MSTEATLKKVSRWQQVSHLCYALHLHVETILEVDSGLHDVVHRARDHPLQQGGESHLDRERIVLDILLQVAHGWNTGLYEEIPPHWARDQTAGSQIETEAKKQETRVRLHRSHRLGSPGVMAKGTSLFWIGGNHGIGQYPDGPLGQFNNCI